MRTRMISAPLLEPISASNRLNQHKLMFGAKDKERERYYLFPGQGGRSARRKHRRILFWSILFGLLVSAAFAGVLYLISKPVR